MNFLAHLYLSGTEEEIIFGNFIGDGVKGKDYLNYSDNIAKGIKLHRFIDDFTDKHPLYRESKAKLRAEYGLYSGIINDVLLDYFLAKNWDRYHPELLKDYSGRIYRQLEVRIDEMPFKTKMFYKHMVEYNRLYNYQFKDSIADVLDKMSFRMATKVNFSGAVNVLNKHEEEMENNFHAFFEELRTESRKYLRTL